MLNIKQEIIKQAIERFDGRELMFNTLHKSLLELNDLLVKEGKLEIDVPNNSNKIVIKIKKYDIKNDYWIPFEWFYIEVYDDVRASIIHESQQIPSTNYYYKLNDVERILTKVIEIIVPQVSVHWYKYEQLKESERSER